MNNLSHLELQAVRVALEEKRFKIMTRIDRLQSKLAKLDDEFKPVDSALTKAYHHV